MARPKFGATAWGYAWLRTIERTTGEPDLRLPRARALSQRHGTALEFGAQSITAAIADGAKEHLVSVRVDPWTDAELATAEAIISQESEHLPAGDIPDHVHHQLTAAGLSVAVPLDDIEAVCTCRARSKPCTHILATLYSLVLSVDERPLTALELRMQQTPSDRSQDSDWLSLSELDPSNFFAGTQSRLQPARR
jgi:uncharacterized Zn finger protein